MPAIIPAINWNDSYSEYVDDLARWYNKNVERIFPARCVRNSLSLLTEENKLMEIVKLIGADVLPEDQKLVIEIGQGHPRRAFCSRTPSIKDDTYVPLDKAAEDDGYHPYISIISCIDALALRGMPFSSILATGIFDTVTKMKYDVPNDHLELFDSYTQKIDEAIAHVG